MTLFTSEVSIFFILAPYISPNSMFLCSGMIRPVVGRALLRNVSSFGQAHPQDHPHLFAYANGNGKGSAEITPGLTLSEYSSRRSKLIQKILSRKRIDPGLVNVDSHLIVIPSARRSYMVEKIPYFFRQDSDFRYFTGN